MHTHKMYVGVDIHRNIHKVSAMTFQSFGESISSWRDGILFDIGNNLKDFQRLDSLIKEYIKQPDEALIAVDHTGHYSEPLVFFLQRMGYEVQYLEPKGVKAVKERLFDSENKNDSVDARGLSYLLYLRDIHHMSFRISAVKPELSSKAYLLRHLILQKQMYNKLLVQATNRLHQFLLATFPEGERKYFKQLLRIIVLYPTPKDIVASRTLKGIKYLRRSDKEVILRLAAETVGIKEELYRDTIVSLSNQRLEAKTIIAKINKSIEKELESHEYKPILFSFPYLKADCAATIISCITDIDHWRNKKAFKKTLGIYSTLKQSGSSLGQGRMGREGDSQSRKALFYVVLGCIRFRIAGDNDFRDYYLRQIKRGKPKMKAIVSTMGKMAEIIYHCLHTKELYKYQGIYRSGSQSRPDNGASG